MSLATLPPHQLVANAVIQSFHNWCSKHKVYKKTYKKIPDEGFEIVKDSLNEIHQHKPGYFHHWWAMNHMRYFKKVRQEHVTMVHELMYHFLTAYCHGRLQDDKDTKKKSRKASLISK